MSSHLSRREALTVISAGTALTVVASSLPSCTPPVKEEKPMITTGTVTLGHASEFPAGTVRHFPTYGIYVVNDSGTPLAILPKCTHLGCTVKWELEERRFKCPCHGSEFEILGRQVKGPATRPLKMVPCTRADDGTLTIDLSRLHA